MTLVFFGTSSFGLRALEAIAQSCHQLKAVVSSPDRPRGRNLKVQVSPVKQWAVDRGVQYLVYSEKPFFSTHSALKKLDVDALVVISFGAILNKEMLSLSRLMPLNVHASLLPKYRGASPMQAAILNQDAETGVTVMRMVERLDAGDILLKKKTFLEDRETIESLEKKLSTLAAEAILEVLETLEKGCAVLTPQREAEASYTQKIAKQDGKINWSENANKIDSRVRAYLGWPGTFFFFRGKRIALRKARSVPVDWTAAPGVVLEASDKHGILVAAGEKSALKLEELQLEGRRPLPWNEFLRGSPLKAGDILE